MMHAQSPFDIKMAACHALNHPTEIVEHYKNANSPGRALHSPKTRDCSYFQLAPVVICLSSFVGRTFYGIFHREIIESP